MYEGVKNYTRPHLKHGLGTTLGGLAFVRVKNCCLKFISENYHV